MIVHQLTAIGAVEVRHFERAFAQTSRLRTEGTDHLLSAAHAIGVQRFVAQSNGAFGYARTGGALKSEEDPLDPTPAREMRETVAALRHLEQALAEELGVKKPMRVLRLIGRLFAGEVGDVMMTQLRGASNGKARRELEWHPAHPTWRHALGAP